VNGFSQQCAEVATQDQGGDDNADLKRTPGWFTLRDTLAFGCDAESFRIQAADALLERVAGGNPAAANSDFFFSKPLNIDSSVINESQNHPNIVRDSYLHADQNGGFLSDWWGHCKGTIYTGAEWDPDLTGSEIQLLRDVEGCVINFDTDPLGNEILGRLDHADKGARSLRLVDSLFRGPQLEEVGDPLNTDLDSTLIVDGFLGMFNTQTGRGYFSRLIENGVSSDQESILKNLTLTQGQSPGDSTQRADGCSGGACNVTWQNACVETNAIEGTLMRAFALDDLGPDHEEPANSLVDYVRPSGVDPNGPVCGGLALPRRLGWQRLGWAHAMLGDGVITNTHLYSSDATFFVPEPSRWLLLGAGLGGLTVLYRVRGRR
jgi:hypothetical protein